jgi:hypothetical protein
VVDRRDERGFRRPTFGRLVAWTIGLGIVVGWLSIYAIPFTIEAGLEADVAQKVPFVGFLVGAQLGVATALLPSARELVVSIGAIVLCALVFGFFGLLFGGVLLGFGVPEEVVDHAGLVGAGLGALLGSAPLVARASEMFRPEAKR